MFDNLSLRDPLRVLLFSILGLVITSDETPSYAQAALKVNALNFARAETDMYFERAVKSAGGIARFHHIRTTAPIDKQDVVRMNRDTLYSAAVFDLQAGPVSIVLPDSENRFMSMMIVNEDHYAIDTLYAPAKTTLESNTVGTRYVMAIMRTFVNPNDAKDIVKANTAQDAIVVEQSNAGEFDIPKWDPESHKQARNALIALGALGGTKDNRFGKRDDVDPISWLIGTAAGWGGNPPKDAIYLPTFPAKNDGRTAYELVLRDVPVDGFWSVTVYDREGFMFENDRQAYSINNVTAKPRPDGSIRIQFGGDAANAENYLAIKDGWNFVIRIYRPRSEILDGSWKAPAIRELSPTSQK